MSAATQSGWKAGVTPVVTAIRHHWRPFVLIQIAAIAVAFCYYLIPGFQAWTEGIARLKANGGLPFAAASTAFAGAVLPEIAKRLFAKGKRTFDWADFGFQVCLFGFLGVTVDLLYRGLGILWGNSASIKVVFEKLVFDQVVYSPVVSMTICTLAFLWKDTGFNGKTTVGLIHDGTFARRYVGNMIACWLFWIPALSAIYAMPVPLQFCLYLCVEAAWALLLLSMAGRE